MLRVTKEEVKGAYKYYGLFYTSSGRVISEMFVLKTDDPEEDALCYDFEEEEWCSLERNDFTRIMGDESLDGTLEEEQEAHALWYLESEHAFNGEGNDEAVEELLRIWTEKKEQFRDEWEKGCWPAKYVETKFYLNGKQYCITPDCIGLQKGESWDEGFMEFLQGEISADLKKLGATEICNLGFLD